MCVSGRTLSIAGGAYARRESGAYAKFLLGVASGFRAGQLEICLIEQGGGSQCVTRPFGAHIVARQRVQVLIDNRNQAGGGLRIPLP